MAAAIVGIKCLGEFQGSRSLPAGQPITNYSKLFVKSYRVYVNCCVGPDWLFSNATDPNEVPVGDPVVASLGDLWDLECCEEFQGLDAFCVDQALANGPISQKTGNDRGIDDGAGTHRPYACYFDIACTFQTPEISNNAQPGQDDPDPRNWDPEVRESGEILSEPLQDAVFLGMYQASGPPDCTDPCTATPPTPALVGINNDCVVRAAGSCGPVITTSGQVVAPPVVRPRYISRLSVTLPKSTPIDFRCFRGRINSTPLVISYQIRGVPGAFMRTYPAGTVLVDAAEWEPATARFRTALGVYTEVHYFLHRYELLIDEEKGWIRDMLNQGTMRAADCAGGVGNCGGKANPTMEPIKVNGEPVDEPVLLDDDGDVLPDGDDPWYLRYARYLEADLNDPNFGLV